MEPIMARQRDGWMEIPNALYKNIACFLCVIVPAACTVLEWWSVVSEKDLDKYCVGYWSNLHYG